MLESVRKQTKPRTVDLYEVFCGVLYLLKSGCQWRMLPSEYPKWRTVHTYVAKWSEPDSDGFRVLERALEAVHDLLSSSTRKAKWMNCKLVLSFRSQFFHRRRCFSIQENERSTTQR